MGTPGFRITNVGGATWWWWWVDRRARRYSKCSPRSLPDVSDRWGPLASGSRMWGERRGGGGGSIAAPGATRNVHRGPCPTLAIDGDPWLPDHECGGSDVVVVVGRSPRPALLEMFTEVPARR